MKNITRNPEDFRNSSEYLLFIIFLDPKVINNRTGSVPIEKMSIVSAPFMKVPDSTAFNCIAWVKPHGSINVIAPNSIGANELFFVSDNNFVDSFLGIVSSNFLNKGDISNRFTPRAIIIIVRIIPIINSILFEITNREPIDPNIPPNMKKEINLEI